MHDSDQFSVNLTHICGCNAARLYEFLISNPSMFSRKGAVFWVGKHLRWFFKSGCNRRYSSLTTTSYLPRSGAGMSFWLTDQYDWRLLLVAAVLAALAGLSATRLIHRAQQKGGHAKTLAVVVAAAAFGCGVWSAYFAGMLAYQPSLAVDYDATLALVS